MKQGLLFIFGFLVLAPLHAQDTDSTRQHKKRPPDADYIERLDTLLHLQTWLSRNEPDYTLVYDDDFKLELAPHELTSLSFGFSYRFLDLGYSFTPGFLNSGQENDKKGESVGYSFGTGFSMYRFKLNFEISSVKGFYLKNTNEFPGIGIPDTPYILYPHLKVNSFSIMLRYNINPRFSTAALTGGTQVQRRSAITFLPTLQIARYRFRNESVEQEVKNEYTNSIDVNFLLPVAGTLVISRHFSASLGIGPSLGVDFFRAVSVNDTGAEVVTKGTRAITGYTLQTALGFNTRRFFAGFESRYRSYGHKIEDLSRLIKQYFYYQVYFGWRLRAPKFMKKSLDWVNKVSPIDLD